MSTITVTEDYHLVIPEEIREKSGLKAGKTYDMIRYDHGVYFVPLRPIEELREIFKGIDTNIDNDDYKV
jgi:bifunctional DNA-binding transcriptional regulator/antitoxin component of YhaV-PrlF toxin-antitoxin module